MGLTELVALFDRSLAERLDIERLNRERIALSQIKGGRLPGLFAGAEIEALMISDVPRDDPAVLASGSSTTRASRVASSGRSTTHSTPSSARPWRAG